MLFVAYYFHNIFIYLIISYLYDYFLFNDICHIVNKPIILILANNLEDTTRQNEKFDSKI